jgi:hypothetical protein
MCLDPMKKKQSKAAFVRSLPTTTPAKDVVAKAKAAGLSLSEPYVYNVRATSKRASGKSSGGARRGRPSVHQSAENLLRAVAANIGLAQSLQILQAEHDRVRRLLSR